MDHLRLGFSGNDERGADDIELERRRWLRRATQTAGGLFAAWVSYPFLASMEPSQRARAEGAPVEADITGIADDSLKTVAWRGQPIWILRRSAHTLSLLPRTDPRLSDPNSAHSIQPPSCRNESRSIRPEYFVAIGICTHLGCSPRLRTTQSGSSDAQAGEFHCPCHGSKFDLAGRVFRGSPAPTNLVIPPHRYLSETRILVGAVQKTA